MSAAAVAFGLVALWLLVIGMFARRLAADWREPVLAVPVLIIESDDWGPGPPTDAERLEQIAAVLRSFGDEAGHPPVLTLGVVLAAPGAGTEGVRRSRPQYFPRTLEETEFAPLRRAMLAGRDAGVFALQLHCMEHFWPPALERAAERDDTARSFLRAEAGVPRHESLPSHLQARWIDASTLPSTALDRPAIERAVADETACFARVFAEPARVAVPVTFTWTTAVETAWAQHGIRAVVTPGTRYVGRDGNGRPVGDRSILRNGDLGYGGVVHVVRDIYFEPALGHTADRVLQEIRTHHRLGRPALLETHRFNFTGDDGQAERSLSEMRRLLGDAVATLPGLRFISTSALAEALRARDPALIDSSLAARVRAFVLRAAALPRLRKVAWASGLAVAAAAALAIATMLRPRATGAPGR